MYRKKLLEQIKKLYINTNDHILDQLEEEYDGLSKQIDELKKINIEGVRPMTHIDETPTHFLREDKPVANILDKEKFLSGAKQHDSDFVIINRSNKND